MPFDWFTVGAQALNFLILVFLMWRFLYQPILHAIDEREKRIAAQLADADARKDEAHQERDDYQQKNEALATRDAALLTEATDGAKAERQRLLDEARQAADALSAKRREALERDAQLLKRVIGDQIQREVFAIARKALAELAGASLEERLCAVFIRRLRESPARASLAEALKTATEPAQVLSAFDLPPEQRAVIQDAVNVTFSADVPLRFITAPHLISGVELTTTGLKVGWSIGAYLTSLEANVRALLQEKGAGRG